MTDGSAAHGLELNAVLGRATREAVAAWTDAPDEMALYQLMRMFGRWRSQLLADAYLRTHGPRIWSGPFKDMEYLASATEGALMPRLLGTYESELHPHLLGFVAEGLDCVIDVGCAEGYYAVGLARLAPQAVVHAHDTSAEARQACAALALRNGVADRVVVGGEFAPDGFEAFAARRALVMVDVEGAELDVLRPDLSPALAGMKIIVETHDLYRPGALATLIERFSPTHEIERVDQRPKAFDLPAWLLRQPQLDQLIAAWEWRARPTPWLVMRPRSS